MEGLPLSLPLAGHRRPLASGGAQGPGRSRVPHRRSDIDFDDWAYNPPFARCLAAGHPEDIAALEEMFLDSGVEQLRWADDTLRRLVGRPVPHVLLLHAGVFDAHILDRLFTDYEKAGVRWISLEEALADPVYRREPDPPRSWRGELPLQMLRAREVKGFLYPARPDPLLERFCR